MPSIPTRRKLESDLTSSLPSPSPSSVLSSPPTSSSIDMSTSASPNSPLQNTMQNSKKKRRGATASNTPISPSSNRCRHTWRFRWTAKPSMQRPPTEPIPSSAPANRLGSEISPSKKIRSCTSALPPRDSKRSSAASPITIGSQASRQAETRYKRLSNASSSSPITRRASNNARNWPASPTSTHANGRSLEKSPSASDIARQSN